MRTRVLIAIVTLVAIVGLFVAGLIIGRSTAPPSPAVNRLALAPAGAAADCWELMKNATRVFEDGCGGPTATPDPYPGPGTATPSPTVAAPTSTPAPGEHDTSVCHHALDGHSHMVCIEDLPADSRILAWVMEDHERAHAWTSLHVPFQSSLTENGYPWPEKGKHVGMMGLYWQFDQCYQPRGGSNASCIWEVYAIVHSMRVAEELYLPVTDFSRGNEHSLRVISCVGESAATCDIVAGGQIAMFGECHTQYKQSTCNALIDQGGVKYPEPYTADQPPYSAVRASQNPNKPADILWSSNTNALMRSILGDINLLVQIVFSELAWEVPSGNPALAGNPAHDRVYCTSSAAGCAHSMFSLWSLEWEISDYPRPYSGFVNRDGAPAPDCTEISFECMPLYIGANVPAGDANLTRVVRDTMDDPLAISPHEGDPGIIYMPGMEP